jgi:homotetrameric cytidine deaminase
VIDDLESLAHGRDDNLAGRLSAYMRNVELKARDPDPARSLERALALGAEDKGEIRQRDTYFRAARGRLKLREQEAGGSPFWDELIEYSRPDSPDARTSSYQRVPVADAEPLRDALDAAYGTLVTVTKRRRLLLWDGVRIHLDEVEGLGSFLEFEAVAEAGAPDLRAEHEKVERLRGLLGIEDGDLVATSYSDLLLTASRQGAPAPDELLRAAEEVMHTAHVPYSHFPVGAALRAPDGSVHVGSNVENASYPQGQCAETSAIGALIAAGHTQITEVAVTAERMDICPPCGGCRQRLAEFASLDTPVYLGRPGGPRENTTVGELLPLAFELDPPE